MDGDESSAEEAGYGTASTGMACARRRYLVLISDTGPGQIRHAGPGRILLQSLRRRAPPSVPVDALAVTTEEVPLKPAEEGSGDEAGETGDGG